MAAAAAITGRLTDIRKWKLNNPRQELAEGGSR